MDLKKKEYLEKRKGPDFMVKWVKFSSFLVWLFIGVIMFVTDISKPKSETFFDRLLKVDVRKFWDFNTLRYAFVTTLLLFTYAFISLLFNLRRLKRKDDRLSISVIIAVLLSTILMLFYVYFFL